MDVTKTVKTLPSQLWTKAQLGQSAFRLELFQNQLLLAENPCAFLHHMLLQY